MEIHKWMKLWPSFVQLVKENLKQFLEALVTTYQSSPPLMVSSKPTHWLTSMTWDHMQMKFHFLLGMLLQVTTLIGS